LLGLQGKGSMLLPAPLKCHPGKIIHCTSKQVRQRLGTYMLDLQYKPETVICVEKPGVDDYAAVMCNAEWLRE